MQPPDDGDVEAAQHGDPLTVGSDLTITFGHAKIGLAQLPGATLAGRVLRGVGAEDRVVTRVDFRAPGSAAA